MCPEEKAFVLLLDPFIAMFLRLRTGIIGGASVPFCRRNPHGMASLNISLLSETTPESRVKDHYNGRILTV